MNTDQLFVMAVIGEPWTVYYTLKGNEYDVVNVNAYNLSRGSLFTAITDTGTQLGSSRLVKRVKCIKTCTKYACGSRSTDDALHASRLNDNKNFRPCSALHMYSRSLERYSIFVRLG